MFDELSTVVLTHDIKDYGLAEGDIGIVVHVYHGEKELEVEFVAASGKTVALLTLTSKDVRSMAHDEILHARGFASI